MGEKWVDKKDKSSTVNLKAVPTTSGCLKSTAVKHNVGLPRKKKSSSASADKTARRWLLETSQFRQILMIQLNWITHALYNCFVTFLDQNNLNSRCVKTTTKVIFILRLMLYTRLASPVAVCIAIRGRYTRLDLLANPNPNPNPNPTNPSYG